MCSAYWNLMAELPCPGCGDVRERELQTHFMGDAGSCVNYYRLGDEVEELRGVTVSLDGRIDDFTAGCDSCKSHWDVGGEIVDGKVVRVWNLPERPAPEEVAAD
jgi:hypothetical protein